MGAWFDDFETELKSTASTAVSLPAPTGGMRNVYTSVQAMRESFIENIRNSRISVPCILISFGNVDPADLSMNDAEQGRALVDIYYVSAISQNDAVKNARLIKGAIENPATQFSTFSPIESGRVSSNVDLALNLALITAAKALSLSTACVKYAPGLLVQMYDS